MDSAAAGVAEGEDELYVSHTCYAQSAESRFGERVLDDLKTFVFQPPHDAWIPVLDPGDVDEEDDDAEMDLDVGFVDLYDSDPSTAHVLETDPSHAEQGFPRIATLRNNLTALSQRYNLYFAAYQDRIYVYQPRRSAPRILPSQSLILQPRPSKYADFAGGAIDPRFPHQVNHIIVGNLGLLEIVLLAYDDGDVIAYYTHAIVRCIRANADDVRRGGARTRQPAHPKPFFHENVGKSAWGMAIHERSRLIAVGSNLHEVTVFAFALSNPTTVYNFPDADLSPRTRCGQTALALEKHLRSRTRTWRIVLPLSHVGDNIPNLAFMDDEAGEADKVVAIDVAGNVWLLDIWKLGTPPLLWPMAAPRDNVTGRAMGWGVLVLPGSSFRSAKTVYDSLGVPGGEVIPGTRAEDSSRVWLDTTCSLYYVDGLSPSAKHVFRRGSRAEYARKHATNLEYPGDDFDDLEPATESESEVEGESSGASAAVDDATGDGAASSPAAGGRGDRQWTALSAYRGPSGTDLDDMADDIQMGRCIIPLFGETPALDGTVSQHTALTRRSFQRQGRTNHVEVRAAQFPAHTARNLCLLRTSQTGIELLPLDRDAPCISCKRQGVRPWDLHPVYSQRVSMLIHVPELNLVAAGSPTGRVALITLTRTAKKFYMTKLRRGFRVECVLPRKSDKKLRPNCTLIGIAMSPAPHRQAKGLELRPGGKRTHPTVYRLILHYKDHSILMYDVAKRGSGWDLTVF
ncbi:6d3c751f-4505-4dd6-ac4f-3af93eb9be9c [Thermothielavioides terrestris]|uniref:6d3c751f-4505-4dd6-ac4f-3af93eb9be9c n=1 Tax=Thermothielavioides terrestris TaxID=2587410 RepID=A0A3S4B060_9PEZI|nr:6d3c751f-4505-4dd6-ac4f-3af93eb9be9c [Thermothielavioides terrestris]